MQHVVLGVDVGGTAVKSWLDDGRGGRPGVVQATPVGDPTGERTADLIAGLVRAAGPVAAVGVAVPGIVDDAAGLCTLSVNLGWRDVPIGALVAERVGLPVAVTHDVRAGAIAERLSGAGAGLPGSLLFAPLGTGLAVARVDETGRPMSSGWAGEVGQLRHIEGRFAGLRVEEVASAGGLARRFGAAGAVDVLTAADAGDPRAAALWTDTVDAVAEVLAWGIAFTAPETVVVGGGLARAGETLLVPLRAALAARLAGFPPVVVLPARHGTEAAAIGAAGLAGLVTGGAVPPSASAQNEQFE